MSLSSTGQDGPEAAGLRCVCVVHCYSRHVVLPQHQPHMLCIQQRSKDLVFIIDVQCQLETISNYSKHEVNGGVMGGADSPQRGARHPLITHDKRSLRGMESVSHLT